MKPSSTIILFFFLILSCKEKNNELAFQNLVFKDTIKLNGIELNNDFIFGVAYKIDHYKDYIKTLTDSRSEGYVHLFSKTTGNYLKSILPKGRGPNEVLYLLNMDLNPNTGNIITYDIMGRRLIKFNIDSIVKNDTIDKYINRYDFPYVFSVFQLKDNFLGISEERVNDNSSRFSILEDKERIFRYLDYPNIIVDGKIRAIEAAYDYGLAICISPDRKRFACSSSFGLIIETFDISDKKIELKNINGYLRPKFRLNENYLISYIEKETIVGTIDMCASDNYIYSILNGKTYLTENTEIATYTWDGKPHILYTCDYELEKICIDEENHKIYAIAQNSSYETVIVEFLL